MENYNKIIKFNDFDNLEYRKGSIEFGGILTQLMDFLRLYDKGDMEFTIQEFEQKSKISIDNIKKLIDAKINGDNLYIFNIEIKNNKVYFTDFKNGKTRPFESNNIN